MNSLKPLLSYAIRNALRKRVVSFLIVMTLAASTMAILATVGVLEGFRNTFIEGETGWQGDIILRPQENDENLNNIERVESKLKEIPEIAGYGIRSGVAGVVKQGEKWVYPFSILGIDMGQERGLTALDVKIVEGDFFDRKMPPQDVVIGFLLADALSGYNFDGKYAKIGDKITLFYPPGEYKEYRIRGIIDAKTFFPNWSLFMEKDEIERLPSAQSNSSLVIRLNDPEETSRVKALLESKNLGVTVRTWQEEASYARDITDAISSITKIIDKFLLLIVFVVIAIVFYIDIMQRKRQMGILKSMGASNAFVVSIFIVQSAGYFLAAFGLGLAVFLTLYWYMAAHPYPLLIGDFRMSLDTGQVVYVFFALLFASVLGSVIPAVRANQTKITDVLRNSE
jgi:putative ABC transport system permease protein